MTFQTETIAILDKTASILDGLAPEIPNPEDTRHAAAKLRQSANALRVEPLNAEDVRAARCCHTAAQNVLERIYEARERRSPIHQTWIHLAVDGWQSAVDLLNALERLHTENRLEPETASLGQGLRRLLPASWWGGR